MSDLGGKAAENSRLVINEPAAEGFRHNVLGLTGLAQATGVPAPAGIYNRPSYKHRLGARARVNDDL